MCVHPSHLSSTTKKRFKITVTNFNLRKKRKKHGIVLRIHQVLRLTRFGPLDLSHYFVKIASIDEVVYGVTTVSKLNSESFGQRNYVFLHTVAVSKEMRRQHVGTKLICSILQKYDIITSILVNNALASCFFTISTHRNVRFLEEHKFVQAIARNGEIRCERGCANLKMFQVFPVMKSLDSYIFYG